MRATDTFLTLFTIYKNPKDYPGRFVVRAFRVMGGMPPVAEKEPVCITLTLEAARAFIPLGCVPLHREPGDDPVIVESWM